MKQGIALIAVGLLTSSVLAGGWISGEITDLGPYSSSAHYYWIHVADSSQTCVDSLRVQVESPYITSELAAGTYKVTCALYMRNDSFLASEVKENINVVNTDTTACNFDFSQKILSLAQITWGSLKARY